MNTNLVSRKIVKRIMAMGGVTLLFILGHYFFYTVQIEKFYYVRIILTSSLCGLSLFGMIFLLANSKGVRSRKVFTIELGMMVLASIMTLVLICMSEGNRPSRELFSPAVLIYGSIYGFVLLLYPFELLCPGLMSIWKYFKLFLPVLLSGVLYYIFIVWGGNQIIETNSWKELLENIWKFDIWFRFTILIYPVWMMVRILRQKKKYEIWCCRNYSNVEYVELGWLNYYLFGFLLLIISYMIVVLIHNYQSVLMHGICFNLFIGFSLYNILRQEVPVKMMEYEYFEDDLEFDVENNNSVNSVDLVDVDGEKYRFENRIPHYKEELEHWMSDSKPYCNKDFKLLDVMQVLPLNRSYLSRLFNDGYGEPFFNFVMRYRIGESVRLLEHYPNLTIGRISEMCGFSSPSVFGRAFLKNKGITPKQYRSLGEKNYK